MKFIKNNINKIKKIRVGDTVIVQRGNNKGKIGEVVKLHHNINKITIYNINLYKKLLWKEPLKIKNKKNPIKKIEEEHLNSKTSTNNINNKKNQLKENLNNDKNDKKIFKYIPYPIHRSNIMLFIEKKPVKVKIQIINNKKTRITKKNNFIINDPLPNRYISHLKKKEIIEKNNNIEN